MKNYLLLTMLLACCCTARLGAQVVITPAGGGTGICTNTAINGSSPGPTTLDTFMIRETNASDLAIGNDTLIIKPPVGWKFWTGPITGFVIHPLSGDISGGTLMWSADSMMVSLPVTGNTTLDTILVYNLQVQPQADTAPAGHLSAGHVVGISGITPTADFADLSLSPSIIHGNSFAPECLPTPYTDTTAGGVWSISDASIATIGSATGIVTTVPGMYGPDTVYYTLPNTCRVSKAIYVVHCEEVSHVAQPYAVSISPNPAYDHLLIDAGQGSCMYYTITNMLGQELARQQLQTGQTEVEVSSLKTGVYFISFYGTESRSTLRFVKM